MTHRFPLLAAATLIGALAACSPAAQTDAGTAPDAAATAATAAMTPAPAASHAAWAGKWIGVEGMYAEITPIENGTYTLTMQSDLDTLGTYTGMDTAEGIAFERGGKQLLLKAATGDETGLKYLAGKKDCLMVAEGEGYCRD